MSHISAQLITIIGWVVYGSFFEWYWHKYWLHTPRFPKAAFRGHTLVHHTVYKGDNSYFLPEEEHPGHILLKPYALPAIVAAHLPIMYLISRFLLPDTMLTAIATITLYFMVYEYCHWNMHVPRGHFIERFRWFHFLRMHHKLHHRYFQKNFCVLFPLADLVMGTLITEEMLVKQRIDREAAIERGESLIGRKKKRKMGKSVRDRMSLALQKRPRRSRVDLKTRLAVKFLRFRTTRRARPAGSKRRLADFRELISSHKEKR